MKKRGVFLFFLTILFVSVLAAPKYDITGIVGLEGNPADSSNTDITVVEAARVDSTDSSGYYELLRISAETYTVVYSHIGYIPDTMTVVLSQDTIINVLLLKTGNTYDITGTVGLSDNPADSSSTAVTILELASEDSTDASGYYEFLGVDEGIYTLVFTHDGYTSDTINILLTGNQTVDTDLTKIINYYDINGTVGLSDNPADSSNTFIEIVELSLIDTTDIHGYYQFLTIEEGNYTMLFTHAGYVPDTVNVILDSNQVIDVTLINLAGIIDQSAIIDMVTGLSTEDGISFIYNKTDNSRSVLALFDISGRTVYNRYISNAGIYKVNMHTPVQGVYFLHIKEQNSVYKKKITIMK